MRIEDEGGTATVSRSAVRRSCRFHLYRRMYRNVKRGTLWTACNVHHSQWKERLSHHMESKAGKRTRAGVEVGRGRQHENGDGLDMCPVRLRRRQGRCWAG